jgi:hypothetical protein
MFKLFIVARIDFSAAGAGAVVKEREPRDRTTVIKKHDDMGNCSKR